MNKLFFIGVVFFLSVSKCYGFVTFSPGQVAKSADFNTNFSELDVRLRTIEKNNSYVAAQVNGVTMKVANYSVGYYSIKTPTGVDVQVDENGNISSSSLYYVSSDCTGQPYFNVNLPDQVVGYVYPNPKFNTQVSFAQDAYSNVYYSNTSSFVRLHYGSVYYGWSNLGCSSYGGTTIATKALPNNPVVTGLQSFPLKITGVGVAIQVASEVGVASTTSTTSTTSTARIVYANGVRIGTTTNVPPGYNGSSAEGCLYYVALDNYPGETIYLCKDGTYTGFSSGSSQDLYYLTANCTGNAYVKVLNNYDTNWWKGSKTITGQIVNQGTTYDLGSQIYKMPTGFLSYKYYYTGGTCRTATGSQAPASQLKAGYKMATVAVQPVAPVFTPPITVQGYVEETQYNTLPAAF